MKKLNLLIVNGVNLAALGTREIDIYGATSFDSYFSELQNHFPDVNLSLFQSDILGELCEIINSGSNFDGIILNAGAYTHNSIALADAVRSAKCPVIEVHITNIFGRENYRRSNVLSPCCLGSISGFGLKSYDLAIEYFLMKIKNN